jgi:hypothetical protein
MCVCVCIHAPKTLQLIKTPSKCTSTRIVVAEIGFMQAKCKHTRIHKPHTHTAHMHIHTYIHHTNMHTHNTAIYMHIHRYIYTSYGHTYTQQMHKLLKIGFMQANANIHAYLSRTHRPYAHTWIHIYTIPTCIRTITNYIQHDRKEEKGQELTDEWSKGHHK